VDGDFVDFLVPTQVTSIHCIQLKNAINNATQKYEYSPHLSISYRLQRTLQLTVHSGTAMQSCILHKRHASKSKCSIIASIGPFSFRKTHKGSVTSARFCIPAVNSPHSEKIRSTHVWEVAAETRSSAYRDSRGYISSLSIQNCSALFD
jgi:hypothetical protein